MGELLSEQVYHDRLFSTIYVHDHIVKTASEASFSGRQHVVIIFKKDEIQQF